MRLLLHEAIPQKNIGSSRCSSQQELLVSSLATADALAKLLIEKVMSHFDCVTVVLVGYHP